MKQIAIDLEVHQAIEQQRRSFAESENDVLRRILLVLATPRSSTTNTAAKADIGLPEHGRRAEAEPAGVARVRGLWTVEVRGKRIAAANLKDAYRILLHELSEGFPDFLMRYSEEKGRSRRFIARSPSDLYTNSPHLARNYAQPLREGWYFDTNLSTAQVAQRARIAARLCGLLYGKDVKIIDNLKEI